MVTVTFSELRNNARKYFDAVEEGQTIEVCRHGKPVAIISPARPGNLSRWRRSKPLEIAGASLSKAILEERERGR